MVEEQISPLVDYIEDCVKLKRDLEFALADLQFQEDGGTLLYAVDHSEIYAYALPGDSPSTREFRFLSDISISEAATVERIVLQVFFTGTFGNLILLPPYGIETQGLVRELRHAQFNEIASTALRLSPQAVSVTREKLFERFPFLPQRDPDPDELEELVDYIEQHAYGIFSLVDLTGERPLSRLRRLFDSNIIQNLNDLVEFEYDEDLADYWYDRLNTHRRRERQPSSWIDALAMAMVEQANQELSESSTRVHLITRSSDMHAVYGKIYDTKAPIDIGNYSLRHPRSLMLQLQAEGLTPNEFRVRLKERLNLADKFLLVTQERPSPVETIEYTQTSAKIDHLLAQIREDWRSTLVLATALGVAAAGDNSEWQVKLHGAQEVFHLLKDHELLRTTVLNRLEEIAKDLDYEHDQLGLNVHFAGLNPQQQMVLGRRLSTKESEGRSILTTSLQAMPYSLEFYSPEIQDLLDAMRPGQTLSWTAFLDLYRAALGTSWDNYERLLATAMLFATLNKWELAEQYCRKSIEIASKSEEVSAHEGYFLLAIAMRKQDPTVERHIEALTLLDKATSAKFRKLGNQYFGDPRYLKEKAVHILELALSSPKEGILEEEIPGPDVAISLLDEAAELCSDDPELIIQIYNNRLYYYVETGQIEDRDKLKDQLKELINLQRQLEPNQRSWPPYILDTIAWATWTLYQPEEPLELDVIIQQLELALNNSEISVNNAKTMKRHLRQVKASRS